MKTIFAIVRDENDYESGARTISLHETRDGAEEYLLNIIGAKKVPGYEFWTFTGLPHTGEMMIPSFTIDDVELKK